MMIWMGYNWYRYNVVLLSIWKKRRKNERKIKVRDTLFYLFFLTCYDSYFISNFFCAALCVRERRVGNTFGLPLPLFCNDVKTKCQVF